MHILRDSISFLYYVIMSYAMLWNPMESMEPWGNTHVISKIIPYHVTSSYTLLYSPMESSRILSLFYGISHSILYYLILSYIILWNLLESCRMTQGMSYTIPSYPMALNRTLWSMLWNIIHHLVILYHSII